MLSFIKRFFTWLFRPPRTPQPVEPRVILGTYLASARFQPFSLSLPEFRKSALIRAVSGAGKSYFLLSMCVNLLSLSEPFSLIDPHGELGADLLKYLLDTGFFTDERAFSRLVYCKWARQDAYLPFNCLAQPRYNAYALASHIHEAIGRAFPTDSATPLLSSILVPATVVLIQNHLPLTALIPMLSDKAWRDELLENVDDPMILDFFHKRFDQFAKPATIESTARRLQLLTFAPVLRFSLGQPANLLDLRRLMDEGVSLVHDFGGLDTDTMRLLACLLTVFYEKAALSRDDIDPAARRDHHLIIDEAPIVVASSATALEHILEQTRKYHLWLKLSHQHMRQFDTSLHAALGNIQTEIVLQQSEDDSRAVAHRFSGLTSDYFDARRRDPTLASPAELREKTAARLEELQTGQAFVRLGRQIQPITTLRIPPPRATRQDVQAVLDEYARRYATPAAVAQRQSDAQLRPSKATSDHDVGPSSPSEEHDHDRYFDDKKPAQDYPWRA